MTAPTTAVEWLLARAAVRQTGLLHIVSRRDTGALNPLCGANPIRSTTIETRTTLDDVALLCEGCGTLAMSMGGTVLDGVALLLGLSTSVTTARLLEVAPAAVQVPVDSRRADTDLVDSVRENGVITPVIARRTSDGLVVIDGVRRIDAAITAGTISIPVVVRDLDDEHAIVEQLLANLHREDLDPIAQASAFKAAMDALDLSQAKLAQRLGIARPTVTNALSLLRLPAHIQQHLIDGTIRIEQARALLKIDDTDEQDQTLDAMLEQRTKPAAPVDQQLVDLSIQIAHLLEVRKVQIKATATGKQIVLNVANDDLARVLTQLGLAA